MRCFVDNISQWVGGVAHYDYTLEYDTPSAMFYNLKHMLAARHELFNRQGGHIWVAPQSTPALICHTDAFAVLTLWCEERPSITRLAEIERQPLEDLWLVH